MTLGHGLQPPPRWTTLQIVLLLTLSFGIAPATAANQPKVDFAHDVVPILRKHCAACHGGNEAKGGFSINTRELILDAAVVEAGNAADSWLMQLVKSADPKAQMPPADRPRLAANEIATLRRWIDGGLAWEAGFTFAKDRYEPPLQPRRPELPPAVDGRNHPIDRIVDAYLAEHGQPRPQPISDASFARRAWLDLLGLLPPPDRLEAFLNDSRPDKRERLIDELLTDNVAYAEHWLTFWNDLLRNDYSGTGFITGGRQQITTWLYRVLVENKPYDQFARELINPTAESEGFIRGIRWRGEISASQATEVQFAQNVSQVFLGINLKCASCHDSFVDRWTLDETYALAAVYAERPLTLHRCEKPRDRVAKAAWLFPELGNIDAAAPQPKRLAQLAALMTHPENGRFTRTLVNRLWHRLLGRGIVHPVDAMHTPPWSADLLDHLAVTFSDYGYDLKAMLRYICTSQAYQAATPAQQASAEGSAYVYAGPMARRMTAEQFMDAVWQVTGSAPLGWDAPVQRLQLENSDHTSSVAVPLEAQWIWSHAGAVAAGEAVTFRRQWELKSVPRRAVAVITADNHYTLYVNGKQVASDGTWETVEVVDLVPHLRAGHNELWIVAHNGGSSKNPAGVFFAARWEKAEGDAAKDEHSVDAWQTLTTDSSWQWTASVPDARGRFPNPPKGWQRAVPVSLAAWSAKVDEPAARLMAAAWAAPVRMVRASLLKNNAFLTALGRPTRDQVVSMRPSELTTLEAIDLANGQLLADAIAEGAQRRLQEFGRNQPDAQAAESLVRWLFVYALSREPTADELMLCRKLLGPQPTAQAVEDLMWSVFMLPEFQLVR